MELMNELECPRHFMTIEKIMEDSRKLRKALEWIEENLCEDFGHQAHFGNKFCAPIVKAGKKWSQSHKANFGLDEFYPHSMLSTLIQTLSLRKSLKLHSWLVEKRDLDAPTWFYTGYDMKLYATKEACDQANERFKEMFPGIVHIVGEDRMKKELAPTQLSNVFVVKNKYGRNDIVCHTKDEALKRAMRETDVFMRLMFMIKKNNPPFSIDSIDFNVENILEIKRDWFMKNIWIHYIELEFGETTYHDRLVNCELNEKFEEFIKAL